MIDKISNLTPVQPLQVPPVGKPGASGGLSFGNVLESAIRNVESSNAEAARAVESFLGGAEGDVHSVALAGQRASLQLEYFLQVRNKVVQAYQEVMRMQL